MKIFLLVSVFIAIAVYEIPGLLRKDEIKELMVFCILLFIGFVVSLLQILNIPIPNPLEWVEKVLRPITQAVF